MSDATSTEQTEPISENLLNKVIATQDGRQWSIEIEGILDVRAVKSLKRSLQVAVSHQRRTAAARRFNARAVRAKEISNDQ